MSLTGIVRLPAVARRLKPLRPNESRTIPAPLRVQPRTNRHGILGTAFDYLLRFELQRRAPHVVAGRWVAEVAALVRLPVFDDSDGQRALEVVQSAKVTLDAYLTAGQPAVILADLAAHAIRLAKLDIIYRAGRVDPLFDGFDAADEDDVEDLLAMLAIVPFDSLIDRRMIVNPTFGFSSVLVGGADADLITGDTLVDFKTTKTSRMNAPQLDQLLGYFLLSRHHRRTDPTFPIIQRVGIYFCRHGHLWIFDVNAWTSHPQFSDIEAWFVDRVQNGFRVEALPEIPREKAVVVPPERRTVLKLLQKIKAMYESRPKA